MIKKSDKNKVYEAYDAIIDWFDAHRSKELAMEKFYLDFILKHIPVGGSILDVGCGTGEPLAKFFIEQGFKVMGIDASEKMIELCEKRFPSASWILADMRSIKLPDQFDLVIAWHSFFHLPPTDQEPTLKNLLSYVKKNGLFVFTSGYEASEEWGVNADYDLYHASLSSEDYEKILKEAGFKVLVHKIKDPDCGDATVWIAKK